MGAQVLAAARAQTGVPCIGAAADVTESSGKSIRGQT